MPPKSKKSSTSQKHLSFSSPIHFQANPSPNPSRGSSPISKDKYDNIKQYLEPNEYVSIHKFGNRPQTTNHFRRNLGRIVLGTLGLGALYAFRNPIMRLGKAAINYGFDKFHNLFQSTNQTDSQNEHNY